MCGVFSGNLFSSAPWRDSPKWWQMPQPHLLLELGTGCQGTLRAPRRLCRRHPHLQGTLDWVFFLCVSLRLMEVRSFWCQCHQTAFFFFFFCLLSAAELRSLPLLVLLPCLTQLLSVHSGQGGCFCQTPSQALQGPAEGHAELLEGSRALPLPPPPTLLSENLALTERCPLPKQGGFKPLLWLLELRDRQGSWIASGCQDSAESTTLREERPWPRGVWLVLCHPWRSTYLSLGFSCLYVLKSVRDVFPSIAENILSENRAVGYHLQWEDWDRYTSQHNEVWEK